jgi:hypothetical protein
VRSLFSYLFSLLDTSSDGLKSIFAIALALLLAVVPTRAQPPQMTPGFGGAPQEGSNDPAESSAYGAALAQPDPASRIVALRHFIVNYPNSSMRQSAISQLMLAQRQTRGGGVSSLGTTPHMTVAQPGPTSAPLPAEPLPIQGVPASGPPRESLLQQAAKPAEITIAPHSLVIKADNSELSAILHQIAGSTGMKIEGLSKDERVFGSYGPGNAREVLLALLEGSGYNVIMVGTTPDGAPRELSLSQRAATAALAPGTVARNGNQEDSDESDQDVQQSPPPEAPIQPLPGNPQNSVNEGAPPQPPRSPQEILQELQRQRLQQQNQNPQ